MASHAIFQYNVLAIDDIHNTWTNMIIKMTILRLLGSSYEKEEEKLSFGYQLSTPASPQCSLEFRSNQEPSLCSYILVQPQITFCSI